MSETANSSWETPQAFSSKKSATIAPQINVPSSIARGAADCLVRSIACISIGDFRPKSAPYSDPHSLNGGAALPVSSAVRAAAVPIGAPT